MRPFRFAMRVNHAPNVKAWRETVRTAEALGYDAVSVCDHFDRQWGPIVALTVAAEATTTLRLATGVLNNDLRHPAVLAKEIATLDLVSDGRVELGLGAGWKHDDYRQIGLDFDRPGTRIDRLGESIDVLRMLWATGPGNYEGEHYELVDAVGLPVPPTRPHPPICVGGGGRRVLSMAARKADIVGFNTSLAAGEYGREAALAAHSDRFDERVAWVREASGERFDHLELQCDTNFVSVNRDRHGYAAEVGAQLGIDAAEVLSMPLALAGTVDHICEQLEERRARWSFSYWIIDHEVMHDFAPVVARLTGN